MSYASCRHLAPFLAALALLWSGVANGQQGPRQKYALLIGCTRYPDAPAGSFPELKGPGNDIPMWARLLGDPQGFAFPADHVVQLVGWPDDASLRPTRANIVRHFETLIEKSGPQTQIVIVLSGHGTQQPIPDSQADPLDPRNPEPDGLDEVFLPADAKPGSGGIENALLDDQIGRWLDQMRARGAAVWIVFDCCHAGTMTRGDDAEVARFVDASLFGVSREKIDNAIRRAQEAVQKAQASGQDPSAVPSKIKAGNKGEPGSLVAFYAAQPFERAPELPLPESAPRVRENYYGLLSFTLVECLKQRSSPISYGQLERLLAARYRAIRGTRFPTPFAEGDLNVEVLGLTRWPVQPDIILKRADNELQISAGALSGLTPGSVLALHPPPGDARDPKLVLGHVKVESVTPTTATVKPCAHASQPAPAVEKIDELSRCRVVSRDFGDMRVKLFAPDAGPVPAALAKLDGDIQGMVARVATEAEAQWILRSVPAAQAREEFGIRDAAGETVLLLQGQGRARWLPADDQAADQRLQAAGRPVGRKVFGSCPADNEAALVGVLERDLPKIFKWQNVWRVASGIQSQDGGQTHDLKFEAFKLKDRNDPTGEPLRGGILQDGQIAKFTVKNEGIEDLWVTVLYLNANLGIRHFYTGQMAPGMALRPFLLQMKADDRSTGMEGLVILVVPAGAQKERPDFTILEQEPLQVAEAATRDPNLAPNTPFGRLLKAAAFNRGTRDAELLVPTTPAVLCQSWVLQSRPR